jgi:HK97 family phage major capsid protein
MNAFEIERRDAQRQLDELLARPSLSVSDRKIVDGLLGKLKNLHDDQERAERAQAVIDETRKDLDPSAYLSEEKNASLELRAMLRGETRTYSAMNLTSEGTATIAPQFADKLVQASKAAGPFYCGSPVLSNIEKNQTGAMKLPVVDDTSASGYVLTENANVQEQEVTGFQSSSIGTKTFSSGIVLASVALVEDVSGWENYSTLLASIVGKRLSRIQNATFLPQLMTALAANSSASVAAGGASLAENDIIDVVTAVDASYKQSASCAFVMNGSTQKALGLLKDVQSRRIFRKVLDATPSIYGYPVLICPSVDSVASGKAPVLFGDLRYVYTRSIPSYELKVLREQFILNRQVGLIAAKRGDLAYSLPATADSALKYIAVS